MIIRRNSVTLSSGEALMFWRALVYTKYRNDVRTALRRGHVNGRTVVFTYAEFLVLLWWVFHEQQCANVGHRKGDQQIPDLTAKILSRFDVACCNAHKRVIGTNHTDRKRGAILLFIAFCDARILLTIYGPATTNPHGYVWINLSGWLKSAARRGWK